MISLKKPAALAIALALLITAASCSSAVKLKNDGDTGYLMDEENGLYYVYCLGHLRAAEIIKSVYAKGDKGEKLYEIPGVDPREWLSENIETMGIPFLFREQNVKEPEFESFGTNIIHVVMTGEINIELREISDPELVGIIVNDFASGQSGPYPEFVTDSLVLYFESEKYPGIYYVLEYLLDDRDLCYLFDRWTGRCVLCSVVF